MRGPQAAVPQAGSPIRDSSGLGTQDQGPRTSDQGLAIMSEAPKSALELVMERLRKKDAEAGITETPLTDAQRAAITEARSVYDARVAERRIMHQSAAFKTLDPEERQAIDDALRRDLERFESDRDSKIKKIREGGPV